MKPKEGDPVEQFASAAAFEAWLEAHHATADCCWLRMAKKESGLASITYAEAVQVALCFGWIDGQSRSESETTWLQRYTPRRPRSKWSKINRERAEQQIAEGRMRPAGLAEVERAKADGRWDSAYAPPSQLTVPADLQAALDANPAASTAWSTLGATNRFVLVYRVNDAKRPETRARRIERIVASLSEGRGGA